ncbi:hypothetical protein P3S67_002955 [Capsicum chacoense]
MLIRQKKIRQTLLVLYFILSYDEVQGKIKLTKLEDLELEKQLTRLNKPAIKTIKTKSGDTYDCIDFYKQPAIDHPLLKNHNFHHMMKPTLIRTMQNSDTTLVNKSSNIWSKDNGCPFRTVHIKRITKDDLIRQKHIPPPEGIVFESPLTNGYKLAIVQVPHNPNNKFAGVRMSTSLWNPRIFENQQHSACRLKIQKGSDILQVGWRVDPTLYGDTKTRSFIHFQVRVSSGPARHGSTQPDTAQFDRSVYKVRAEVSKVATFGYFQNLW